MTEPKRYKATTLRPETPDPFVGYRTREVKGYYVKHLSAQPYPISTQEEHDQFVKEHTKHYIIENGWADWGMRIEMEMHAIDISTLEEIE